MNYGDNQREIYPLGLFPTRTKAFRLPSNVQIKVSHLSSVVTIFFLIGKTGSRPLSNA